MTEAAQLALSAWDVGRAVRLYRSYTGAKQTRIAAAVGISQSEVSRLEHGSKKIRDRQQLMIWTRALGIPDHLLPALPSDETAAAVSDALWLPQVTEALSAIGELTGADVNRRLLPAESTLLLNRRDVDLELRPHADFRLGIVVAGENAEV